MILKVKKMPIVVFTFVLCLLTSVVLANEPLNEQPNIIFIYADDLGYGDISSYGSTTINTPHIDQLAKEGIKFTSFYSASNVCSPSRASFLTGRYPFRTGVNSVFYHDSLEGMPSEEVTIAELLQQADYKTGLVGKWHLGILDRYMPWNQGFDEFYGTPHSNDMSNFYWYENKKIIFEPIDQRFLTKRYTEKALTFIKQNKDEPFFLYLAHSMPHVPLYVSPKFEGTSKGGLYGDVVEELDWSVGEIIKQLQILNLDKKTLVIFSSDNGPMLAMRSHGGSAGFLREGKATPFEGGQRVPTIAWWPEKIVPRVVAQPANMMDWLPTFASLANIEPSKHIQLDGENISSVLFEGSERKETPFYYFQLRIPNITEQGHEFAGVRLGDWKLTLPRDGFYPRFLDSLIKIGQYSRELELFNLEDDPYERNNLAEKHPEKVNELLSLIDGFKKESELNKRPALQPTALAGDHSDNIYLYSGIASVVLFFIFVAGFLIFIAYKAFEYCRR